MEHEINTSSNKLFKGYSKVNRKYNFAFSVYKISRLRLNIIIVSVEDLLIVLLILDICRLAIHSFHNSTALLPVLVRYKGEIVILMKRVRALKHDGLNIFSLVNQYVLSVTVLLAISPLIWVTSDNRH